MSSNHGSSSIVRRPASVFGDGDVTLDAADALQRALDSERHPPDVDMAAQEAEALAPAETAAVNGQEGTRCEPWRQGGSQSFDLVLGEEPPLGIGPSGDLDTRSRDS